MFILFYAKQKLIKLTEKNAGDLMELPIINFMNIFLLTSDYSSNGSQIIVISSSERTNA